MRGLRRLTGRRAGTPARGVVIDQITAAVAERERLDRQRALALVGLARTGALITDQRAALVRTRGRVEQAIARAERVGAEHAAAGDDTGAFERTVAALQRELDVVDVLLRQLDAADLAAHSDAAKVQAVWQQSSDRLNAVLGSEVKLLVRLEKDARRVSRRG